MRHLYRLWQVIKDHRYKILFIALFIGILFTSFWIRIQGVDRLPEDQFTENDAYLYQFQSRIISEKGYLPARDMSRWLPNGRDNGQLFPLYSYAIGYLHIAISWISSHFTHYQIQLYLPPLCFLLALGVLFIFLYRLYGLFFASIVCVLLATFPGSVERSAAGFGDRDAWCWMLGVVAVSSYLWKEQASPGRQKHLRSVVAGMIVFLGGLSWEGFGIFVLIILCVELWKFCSTETEEDFTSYLIWVLLFVPWLYLLIPAYRGGYGFSSHVAAPMLATPLIILVIRSIRLILVTYIDSVRPHAKKLAWGLTVVVIGTGIGYFFLQYGSFEVTAFIFRKSRLMESVGELVAPTTRYWYIRYGTAIVLGSIGLVFGCGELCRQKGKFATALNILIGLSLMSFILTTFLRENISNLLGPSLCDSVFLISLGLIAVTLSIAFMLQKTPSPQQQIFLVMFVWFLLWSALARDGKRYDFFVGLPIAFGTAWLFCVSFAALIRKCKESDILNAALDTQKVTTYLMLPVLGIILLWAPFGGHALRAVPAAAQMRPPIPGYGEIAAAIEWAKTDLPSESVIASNWDFGTQFNVLADVKTIIDSDHFIPNWIHLYFRHVFCAPSEQEALEFLKTHNVTHLMLVELELLSQAWSFSYIGSNENMDRRFRLYHLDLILRPVGAPLRAAPHQGETPIEYIEVSRATNGNYFISTRFRSDESEKTVVDVSPALEVVNEHTAQVSVTDVPAVVPVDIDQGGILLFFDSSEVLYNAYYVPPLGWNSLAVKLFMRGEYSQTFVPVYATVSEDSDAPPKVKIWKIQYPPNIQTNEKYLATEPVYSVIDTDPSDDVGTHDEHHEHDLH